MSMQSPDIDLEALDQLLIDTKTPIIKFQENSPCASSLMVLTIHG